jgi:hypothetical protein
MSGPASGNDGELELMDAENAGSGSDAAAEASAARLTNSRRDIGGIWAESATGAAQL